MALPQRLSPSSLAVSPRANPVPRNQVHRYAIPSQKSQSRGPELLVMIGINLAIATVAGLAVLRLLPYNAEQQRKLQALEVEVNALDQRVDHLRQEFTNYFDPQQTRSNMRILSDRVEDGQRKLVLIDPPAASLPFSGAEGANPAFDPSSVGEHEQPQVYPRHQ
ncbi:MAG: hypothetical protein F6K30_10000 [Cyanothece sp. SIO2G6]|nr:hypothetical protein [Cyanothece sp. SIO2G6]